MTDKPKETAFQKRMKAFHEAQALTAAARQRAKGGEHEHRSIPLGEEPGGAQE